MQFAGPLVDMASIAARYEKPEDLYAAGGVHPSKAGSLLIANHIASLAGELLSSRRDAVSSLSQMCIRDSNNTAPAREVNGANAGVRNFCTGGERKKEPGGHRAYPGSRPLRPLMRLL